MTSMHPAIRARASSRYDRHERDHPRSAGLGVSACVRARIRRARLAMVGVHRPGAGPRGFAKLLVEVPRRDAGMAADPSIDRAAYRRFCQNRSETRREEPFSPVFAGSDSDCPLDARGARSRAGVYGCWYRSRDVRGASSRLAADGRVRQALVEWWHAPYARWREDRRRKRSRDGVGGFIGLRIAEGPGSVEERTGRLDHSEVGRADGNAAQGVDVIVGDGCDPAATAAVCEGAEVVVHTAAVVLKKAEELYDASTSAGTGQVVTRRAAASARSHQPVSVWFTDSLTRQGQRGRPMRGEGNRTARRRFESEESLFCSFFVQAQHSRVFEVSRDPAGDGVRTAARSVGSAAFELLRVEASCRSGRRPRHRQSCLCDNLVDALFLVIERDASSVTRSATARRDLPGSTSDQSTRLPVGAAFARRPRVSCEGHSR